jgi:hypothetical protein
MFRVVITCGGRARDSRRAVHETDPFPPPPPPSRTDWTRLVPHSVLTGRVSPSSIFHHPLSVVYYGPRHFRWRGTDLAHAMVDANSRDSENTRDLRGSLRPVRILERRVPRPVRSKQHAGLTRAQGRLVSPRGQEARGSARARDGGRGPPAAARQARLRNPSAPGRARRGAGRGPGGSAGTAS